MACKHKEPQSYQGKTMLSFTILKSNGLINADNKKNMQLKKVKSLTKKSGSIWKYIDLWDYFRWIEKRVTAILSHKYTG